MPSHTRENVLKRDRIPSKALLHRRKPTLQAYWKDLMEEYPVQFASEVKISLTGKSCDGSQLVEETYRKLVEKTRYLVDNRGYPEWDP